MKNYDFAIIGAGIEGLVLSTYLAKLGKDVCLIEASPKLGGNFRTTVLDVFQNDDKTNQALHFLGAELGSDFGYEKTFVEPTTFDKNSFQPFVGFGDEAPPYLDWLNPFVTPDQIFPNQTLIDLLLAQATKYSVETLVNATVTSVSIDENRITEISINGKPTMTATHFISTLHPLKMGKWNKDLLSTKFIQKMNKSTLWTTLDLEFTHPENLNATRGWYLLKSTKADWFVGRFTKTGSHWLAFVSEESEADTEITGHLFKEAKKAFAKAFPGLVSQITFEKLSVLSHSHGQIQFKLNQENPFHFKNLWVCTGLAAESLNPLVAGISAAQELLMDLQIHGYIENMPKNSDLESGQENPVTL